VGRSLRYYYRFYDKKRGDRRTASSTWGNIWLSLFFGAFLLGGLGLSLGIFATMTLPELRVNRDFVETTCRVVDKQLDQEVDAYAFRPKIKIEFQVAGVTHRVETTYDIAGRYNADRHHSQAILDAFQVGQEYPCWYDPRDHERAVLVQGYSWYATLMLLFPVPFLAIGGGGLIFLISNWGKSTERRAVQSQQAAERDPFNEPDGRHGQYPSVPDSSFVTNSPGTTLAYRLPIATPTWSLLALLAICLLFNGIVGVFVTMFVRGIMHGTPEWSLVMFIGPFGAAGAALIYFFVRQVMVVTGIGLTLVEISDHPLYPGGKYEVFISQSGRLKVKSFRVILVCDEESTYHQGTNTRTAHQRVREHELFRRDNFEIQPGAPFETQVAMEVSEGAMHSFKSANNQIGWKIFVRGEVEGKPDYERAFLVTVYPSGRASAKR
jgi:hypothetical protein